MSYVGKITDTSGNTGLVGSTLYGTCSTGASTAAKVVTCSDFDKLLIGVTIHVKFTNSNTASTPTLNVNSTGAKNIYKYGTTKPGTTAATSWYAGSVVSFTYDGSYWQMNDHLDDTNTDAVSSVNGKTGAVTLTASDVGASTTDANVTQTATTTDANYEILFSGTADNTTRTEWVRKSSTLTFNPYDCVLTTTDASSGWTSNLTGYDIDLTGTDNTWDGTNTSLKSAISSLNSSKMNKSTILRYLDGSQIGTPSKITMSSSIVKFTSGEASVAFSHFGATSRPDVLILTCQSQSCAMEYVFDSSSSQVKLKLVGNTTTGNVRFCWICVIW